MISYARFEDVYRSKLRKRAERLGPLWRLLSRASERKPAAAIIAVAVVLGIVGGFKGAEIRIGDVHRGVPELRSDSRYNVDSGVISDRFSIGVDLLTVVVETIEEGCIDYDVMETIDRFEWRMSNVDGVQSVMGLPSVAKRINAGWNEGNLKWRVLPRSQPALVQAVSYVPTASGLLNADCSVMPVLLFTSDHEADTVARIVAEVKTFRERYGSERVKFRLATGNVGVMAATNEEVARDQFPILLGVFSAVIVLCLITFRSMGTVLSIVLPLGLVSLLAYALMAVLEIGLKVSTLPVVALGVGIGVDYGIYIYSRFQGFLEEGRSTPDAYREALTTTGSAVVFTGITLATGVVTWMFSPLKFQADMGILLTFMFLLNMLGAILVLPALKSRFSKVSS
jgi:predicted RND superfamily exporter protein